MRIIKRNGNIEAFALDKVRTSILNSALDIGFTLTESDLNLLSHDIEKKLREIRRDSLITSSYEVRGVVYHVLIDSGFVAIGRAYIEIDL